MNVLSESRTEDEDTQSLPSIEAIGAEIEVSDSESTIGYSNVSQPDDAVQAVVSKAQRLASNASSSGHGRSDGFTMSMVTLGASSSDPPPRGDHLKSLDRSPLTKEEIALVKGACPIDWFSKGLDYMTSIDPPKVLSRLLRLWIRIQEQIGWPTAGRHGLETTHSLPSEHRPPIYSPWMKSHRPPKIPKSMKFDVDTFIPQFRRWWSSFQPAWRRTVVSWPLRRDEKLSNDWRAVAKGGSNGLYLITLGLVWQLGSTSEGDTSRQMVLEHIDDVEWAYERILDTLTKLPRSEQVEKPVKERKRRRVGDSKLSIRCEHCGCTGACKKRRRLP